MASNIINVNRSRIDAYYRYKMPCLVVKKEKNRTVIENLPAVSKALSRLSMHILKYFGYELGTQTATSKGKYSLNGSHSAGTLQNLLDGFISVYVLCHACDNPETVLINVKSSLRKRCGACGITMTVESNHKLGNYILKELSELSSEKRKSPKKNIGKKKTTETYTDECNDLDDDSLYWGDDTSDLAVKERMMDLTDSVQALTLTDDAAKSERDRINMFHSFLTGGVKRTSQEIVNEAQRLDVTKKATIVLAEVYYDVDIINQIKANSGLFRRFTDNSKAAQHHLLGGFEQLVGLVHPTVLLPKILHILKSFYDNDVLDEDVILEWSDARSNKYLRDAKLVKDVHDRAQPFIKWLREAEEEAESSDEDVVFYSNQSTTNQETEQDEYISDSEIDLI